MKRLNCSEGEPSLDRNAFFLVDGALRTGALSAGEVLQWAPPSKTFQRLARVFSVSPLERIACCLAKGEGGKVLQ
ncbi:unnamed protein product [Cyberlindnera jadinii]|uniref:Uncharacterized protein n=1 Tax=Cyberlindnera jadinii (strain ATCC 18201 / CBS 1600 / BCRC 20928 / JCM 3617 / NBRC 0987 / NRRL Y-1542) TaxID=983966 RepID=A0A0H5C9T0_CYBJN|nr:unnamed protein product [Cyberlindnera jadinii]